VALAGMTLLAWVLPEAAGPGSGFAAEKAELAMALWTIVAIQAALKATQNSVTRPARETLFTVVGREGTYKSKSFLDTVVLRGGDALFAWSHKGLHEVAKIGGVGMAAGLVPFAAAWIGLGYFLGRRQEQLARAEVREAAR
jgi:AAA family ATP:ADP antiporter